MVFRRALALILVLLCPMAVPASDLRLGLVGLDTSHVVSFAAVLNDPNSPEHVPERASWLPSRAAVRTCRQAVPYRGFTRELQEKYGVALVETIAALGKRVDGVLLTSNDGRVHLAQVREIVAARKPMFIDKPLAATLEDAREIARIAKQAGVPWFSASTMRYTVAGLKDARISGIDTWGPGPFEEHHQLDLSWYAIHAAEMLYALMGTGCAEVTRTHSGNADVVVCRWKDGRIGSMRALRPRSSYGAIVFRETQEEQTSEVVTPISSDALLLRDAVKFFRTGIPPVPNEETLEMFAFFDAAQRSKHAGGKPMKLR